MTDTWEVKSSWLGAGNTRRGAFIFVYLFADNISAIWGNGGNGGYVRSGWVWVVGLPAFSPSSPSPLLP